MKSQVLHTVWCHISYEAAGEFWHWSLSGVKGLTPLYSFPNVISAITTIAFHNLFSLIIIKKIHCLAFNLLLRWSVFLFLLALCFCCWAHPGRQLAHFLRWRCTVHFCHNSGLQPRAARCATGLRKRTHKQGCTGGLYCRRYCCQKMRQDGPINNLT